jgi:hypothetical protein
MPIYRKESCTMKAKKVYVKPKLKKLGLLRRVTKFTF